MTTLLISLQGTILVYLGCGFILRKVGMMDEASNLFLSRMLTGFLLPVNVFVSFIRSFTFDGLFSCLSILLLGVLFESSIYLFTKTKFKSFNEKEMAVARYDMLVSNGGLIGTPIIESLFGSGGVLYANVFLIPQRIMIYSAGESIFNPKATKSFNEIIMSIVSNKIIIAMSIGLLIVGLNIQIPNSIYTALHNIGKCLSPMSLMLVGSMLADKIDINVNDLKNLSIIVVFRQLIFPLTVMLVLIPFPIEFTIKAIMVLLIGMPVGATAAVYANRYNGDTRFASMSVFLSTLSSTLTLVMLMAIMECVFI